MNIQEHPNTKEYLAHFLLSLQKHAILHETETFEVDAEQEGKLCPTDLELLQ